MGARTGGGITMKIGTRITCPTTGKHGSVVRVVGQWLYVRESNGEQFRVRSSEVCGRECGRRFTKQVKPAPLNAATLHMNQLLWIVPPEADYKIRGYVVALGNSKAEVVVKAVEHKVWKNAEFRLVGKDAAKIEEFIVQ